MPFTRPKASQIDFDVTNITDPLIRLNSGESGSADKDVGIVIERGSDTNAAIIYDESADEFVVINTTEDGTTSGNVTISSYADLRVAQLKASSVTMTGALAMGTNKITGMGDPTANQDAATKAYVDTQVSSVPTGDITAVNITAGTGLSGTVSTSSGDHTQTLAIDSTVATLTGTQTLENKTLTTPIISSISNTGTLTLPTSTGTVALTSDITLSTLSVTANATEINTLDGITASTAELNILDGVTATASELNILDGVTATTTELNYTDGVTSNIQTQLDARLALSGGTMTGDIILPADGTIGAASDASFIKFNETSTAYSGHDLSIGSNQSVHVLLDMNNDGNSTGGFTVRTGATSVDSSTELFKVNGDGAILADGAYDFDIASHDGTNGLKLGGTLITSTAAELNYLDGVTGITLGSANELLVVGTDGSSIASDSTLAVDTANNRLGINQTSPEVTLHMTGEDAQTAQIRMEQYNNSADAPDIRTRRYRGTVASPLAVNSGDYLFRSNHEYWNGTSIVTGGSFAFDNTNNAARTEYRIAVDTDGTGADVLNGEQFKIDGNDGGAITFNDAYKFPTSDGSANQFLQTDGAGAVTFASATVSDISDLTATATELNYVDGVTSAIQTQLDAKLALAGGTMSGAIAMGTNKITGMGDPTANQDAATKAYVDTQTSSIVTTTDIAGDTGTDTVTLGSDTLTFSGTANEITTAVTDNTVTISLPDDVTIGSDLTVTGNLTVNGTTTTISTTNSVVSDSLIELNTGAASNTNDLGIVMERGSTGDNAFIGWDESADKFVVGTTTATGTSTGDLTVSTGTLVANIEGNVTGNVTGDVTGNADTATALATARTIAGQSFDGSANIAIASTDLSNTSNITLNDATQTLTNKTLTTPVISSISNTGTLTLPTSTGTVALTSDISLSTLSITATAAELNILDGVTATASELNILDGVTATTAELNILDGVTATASELNIIDGDTSATSTTLADADRVVVNDAGTMKQVALTDFETYFETALDTLSNVTSVGTLNGLAVASTQTVTMGANRLQNVADPVGNQDAATKAYVDANAGSGGGASGFTASTTTTAPGSDGDFDLSFNVAQDTQETPFESGGSDAFGVSLGEVYDQMEPVGSTSSVDLGVLT